MKYFDKKNKRLILVGDVADERFWDDHWKNYHLSKMIYGRANNLVTVFTKKFLKSPAKVLDAGCGAGQNIYFLKKKGYDSYGIDFARETIKESKKFFPDLNLYAQDIRKLEFSDSFFDGYWSLGVIEHYWDGYSDIIREARRVIRTNGYLFLTVPWFSPLRRVKAKFGFYSQFSNDMIAKNFYEFMLNEKEVVKNMEQEGFVLVYRHPLDAIKGMKSEIVFLRSFLQKLYDSKNIFTRAVKFFISSFFAPFAGHIILLVFRKSGADN